MASTIKLSINQKIIQVEAGISVAAAIAIIGDGTRLSVSGGMRAPVCGMGICQECRVTINGQKHQLACQTLCAQDMQIFTGALA
jgi:succinate dehydrogenase/fumarate reductase-like Fe-S protein